MRWGKQTKKWSSMDKGGGKSKRKEKGREGEIRKGERKRERERERNKKGVPLLFKIYGNWTVSFCWSKN